MLISMKGLFDYNVHATDGDIGKIFDFYFDDKEWKIKYFIVTYGNWIDREKVLLSPFLIKKIDHSQHRINISIDREMVKNSPDIDSENTVSQLMKNGPMNYYQWPLYWRGVGIAGTTADFPGYGSEQVETHLRSVREIIGYHLHSPEKIFGEIEDVIVQDSNWHVDSLVAKTEKWLPSKSVLLKPKNIESISWEEREFQTSLPFTQVRKLPEYHSTN